MTATGPEPPGVERTRLGARALDQWPLVTVLGVMCGGAGIAAAGHWRWASFILGCGVSLAAFWRLVLPPRLIGLLAVRSRWFDVAVTGLMGVGIVALALVVPPMRPR